MNTPTTQLPGEPPVRSGAALAANPLLDVLVEADTEVRRIEEELKASSSQYQWACRIRDNAWDAYKASKDRQAANAAMSDCAGDKLKS